MSDKAKLLLSVLAVIVSLGFGFSLGHSAGSGQTDELRAQVTHLMGVVERYNEPQRSIFTTTTAVESATGGMMDDLDEHARCFGYRDYQHFVQDPEGYDPNKIGGPGC